MMEPIMVKKLNELAAQGGESNLTGTIRDSATNIWLAGLGAFAKAQEEGGKLFEALVKEGEAVQKRASKSAQEAITDARTKATGTWDKLEQVFVDRVSRALTSLNVPTKPDIDALAKRVEELTKATAKLSHTMAEGGAKHKEVPMAKKPTARRIEAPAKKAAARVHN
jgi:poly(hydroxyalkanoate) granule-associated protein